MTKRNPSDVAPARDFDGQYKALFKAHPREALEILCGAQIGGREVILEAPTELAFPRNRHCDLVFTIPGGGDGRGDVYHIEFQLKRTGDFQERMVAYWGLLAVKYPQAEYDIHQVVFWPEGGGYPGRFQRNGALLIYLDVNVPDDLDPEVLLGSPLAALALATRKPPPDLVERLADVIAGLDDYEEQLRQINLSMLVEGTLVAQLVDAVKRRGMSNVLANTETGREIREEGHADSIRILLRANFGEISDLEELSKRLTAQDYAGNLVRIAAGATLEELRA